MIRSYEQKIYASDVLTDSTGRMYALVNNPSGTTNVVIGILDNLFDNYSTNNIYRVAGSMIELTMPSDNFVGFFTATVCYNDSSNSGQLRKKRLFEQTQLTPEELSEYDDYNIALGKEGYPTVNTSLDNLKSYLQSGGTYNYLSNNPLLWNFDATEKQTALAKLGTYSSTTVNSITSSLMPITGVIDSVSAFTKTNISNTPTFNNVISTGGVSCYFTFTVGATEVASYTKVGSFTITANSAYDISTAQYIAGTGLIYNSNNILLGMPNFMIQTSASDNVISVNVYLADGVGGSGSHTINASVEIPVYVVL